MTGTPLPWRVKFCGLRHADEVRLACGLGVWAVGFVLTESCRRIDRDACARLAEAVTPGVLRIGVFTDETPEVIGTCIRACGLDAVQIHAEHPPEVWATFAHLPVIRAVRVCGSGPLTLPEAVRGELFLLDAAVPGQAGGTGVAFDWTLARDAGAHGRLILAGGLTPETAAEAIRTVRPYALDVSSGIEASRGIKSPDRMRAFAEAVRACGMRQEA